MFMCIFFAAEQRNSLGKVWHPGCLRCEECGKRLNPGQHSEVRYRHRLQEIGSRVTRDKTLMNEICSTREKSCIFQAFDSQNLSLSS